MAPWSEAEAEALRREFHQILRQNVAGTLDRMRDRRGTIVLNSDDLFHRLPRYVKQPDERKFLGHLLYPVAAGFTDEVYALLLARPVGKNDTVVFTAGGSATGKSTILRSEGQRPEVDFIVDTTFSNSERALRQVDTALASGRKVRIYYVHRDFSESVISMLERALNPKVGRIVPIDDMARTHFGAQRTVLDAITKYGDDRRVVIELTANSAGVLIAMIEEEFFQHLHESIDSLERKGQYFLDELRENQAAGRRDNDKDHHPGRKDLHISEALYEAARSQAQAGKSALE